MILFLAGSSAFAQQSVIDHCRGTSSDADRIACLEAALLGREMTVEEPEPAQIDPPSMEIEAGPDDTSESAQIDPPVERPSGIGATQVIARSQTREDQREALEKARGLRVSSYSTVPYEKLVVFLENGQVWRQTKGDLQKIRVDLRRNQTVDITESSIGGYKLRLNEMRRTLRVERVK